jgi:TPR repeat protein
MVLTRRGHLQTLMLTPLAWVLACQGVPYQPGAAHPGAEPLVAVHPELEAPCRAGSIEACVKLGRAGVQHGGLGAGVHWLLRACDLDPRTCVALGDALIGRRANASDPVVAAHAYRRACEADHRGACYELAVLHYLGLGVDVDDPLSARLHHAACEGGIPEGCAYLGFLYERGFGVQPSAPIAAYYRDLACRRGFEDLCGGGSGTRRAAIGASTPEPAAPLAAPSAAEPPRTKPSRPIRFKPTTASPTED